MASEERTNLQRLKPSRAKLHPGDVFALQIADTFYFGRVIMTDANPNLAGPANLIYIFRGGSSVLEPPAPERTVPENLLIAPAMINRLPWSKGYFQTIEHRPIEKGDRLAKHSFRSTSGRYFDEYNHELPGPIEPCGDRGLHSYRTIDDQVSDALGIPRVPFDP